MAATTAKSTKRKSTDSTEQMLKKIKVAKSAERPLPVKSALKKDGEAETAAAPAPAPASKSSKAAAKENSGVIKSGAASGSKSKKAAAKDIIGDEEVVKNSVGKAKKAAVGESKSQEKNAETAAVPKSKSKKAAAAAAAAAEDINGAEDAVETDAASTAKSKKAAAKESKGQEKIAESGAATVSKSKKNATKNNNGIEEVAKTGVASAAKSKEAPAKDGNGAEDVAKTGVASAAKSKKAAIKDNGAEKLASSIVAKPKKSSKGTLAAPPLDEVAKKEIAKTELPESDDNEEVGSELTADQTAALLAGFSSSEEEDDDEEEGIPISKLPKAPIDRTLANKAAEVAGDLTVKNTHDNPETTPGTIYIGRLPHGFFEQQMRAYFTQFGKITHLRLARSKKTARSQHYAFIEFASAAVADIVAKTMDKYLMFNHILQVRRVPAAQVKDTIWKGEGRRRRAMPMNRIEGTRLRKGTTREGWDKRIEREETRRQSKAEKLKELGYEYEAPALKRLSEAKQIDAPIMQQTAEEQLLEETQDAAAAEKVQNTSNISKKRAAAAATGEARKTKKSKAKA